MRASAALLVAAAWLTVPSVASAPSALAASAVAASASAARARQGNGSELLNETFAGAAVEDPGFLALNDACLTGAPPGPDTTGPGGREPGTCSGHQVGPVPQIGRTPGYLQLTDAGRGRTGGVLYNRPLPGNGGLDLTFEQYQYGGVQGGGDGIAFFLTDGAGVLNQTGAFGGSLGYAQRTGRPGVDHGYLGLGLDAYGNYAVDFEGRGTGCPADQRPPAEFQVYDRPPNNVTLRGPGHEESYYCYLGGTGTTERIGTDPDGNVLFGSTLPGRLHEPAGDIAQAAGRTVHVVVSAEVRPTVSIEMDFHDGNGFVPVLSRRMPEDAPRTYKFGFTASTGSATDVHLIRQLRVRSSEPLGALNLVKQVDRTTPQPPVYRVGDVVPYQFVVTNTGGGRLTDVKVNDPRVADIRCPRDTLEARGEPLATMTCTGTHTITVADAAGGRFDNAATADGRDAAGADVHSGPSEVSVPVEGAGPVPVPVVAKTASTDRVRPGDEVTYMIRVRNEGTGPLVNGRLTDDLSGVLDDGDLVGTPEATAGNVVVDGTRLEWTGALDPGREAVITYTVRAHAGGDGTMRNAVRGLGNCQEDVQGPPCATLVEVAEEPPPPPPPPGPHGHLTITKWADRTYVRPGQRVVYRIRVENTGDGPLPDASFRDDLSAVLRRARLVGTPEADHGEVSYRRPVLRWHGSLAPGRSAVIEYTVVARHRGRLPNRVVSSVRRTNCRPHSRDPRCTAVVTVVPGPQKDREDR
ncbi:DUF11 domain-containing protein [Actinomadura logoneensis]|uniref:DUF11 domain-containing protein n=2 Tax=Actinomadura logoneensis TaxID=2293572 RepID=A0A372JKB0_9ACTN|nr:DUF11 domain-containing protein [Actinomadura logoneensis]